LQFTGRTIEVKEDKTIINVNAVIDICRFVADERSDKSRK